MFITECSSECSNKNLKQGLLSIFYRIVSNFNSQSCFILSSQLSQSPMLRIIRTCFPLLEDLSSELQVLIYVEGQLKRITPSTIH